MSIAKELRAKAAETARDADRYELNKRALEWLDFIGPNIDIFPHFSGQTGSSCVGYTDVMKLLDEQIAMKMSDVILAVRANATAEIAALELKHG
ncbi:hypothetical protein [Mesorhizobium sp. M0843]|uniref:hypothetical protein n=1 Tax=Mesorhizobium sp. M0843 TaxID=2957010 RepID=UPI00333BC117